MTNVLIITRHQATVEWIKSTLFDTDTVQVSNHYTPGMEEGAAYVVGILPVNLIADLCRKGVRYYQVVMDVPEEFRGKELTIEQMDEFGARLVEYYVEVR